jgi:hypothetical protein
MTDEIQRLRAARDAALNAIEEYNVAADAAIAAYLATFDAANKAYNAILVAQKQEQTYD